MAMVSDFLPNHPTCLIEIRAYGYEAVILDAILCLLDFHWRSWAWMDFDLHEVQICGRVWAETNLRCRSRWPQSFWKRSYVPKEYVGLLCWTDCVCLDDCCMTASKWLAKLVACLKPRFYCESLRLYTSWGGSSSDWAMIGRGVSATSEHSRV